MSALHPARGSRIQRRPEKLGQRGSNAWAVVGEQISDQFSHTCRRAALAKLYGDDVAVHVDRIGATGFEDPAGHQVGRTGAKRVVDGLVALVCHAGEGAVCLKTHNAVFCTRLFNDGNKHAHSAAEPSPIAHAKRPGRLAGCVNRETSAVRA
jgi:hypothetical protein